MNESTTITEHSSPCASLAAIGVHLQSLDLFAPIRQTVQIAQKTVKYSPADKLNDAFITILAGAHGLVEVNSRLRADVALQRAFGRTGCAEQSVVQETLDHATAENVTQMAHALTTIVRQHSQAYRHDYATAWHILDVDMSGLPCGPKAAFATKGYFAHQRNRRGRQLGRVLATRYQEIVVDQIFDGKTQLATALQPLVSAAEDVLGLSDAQRAATLMRVDAGGGSVADINWLLARGYQVLAKDYSSVRSARVAASVSIWFTDPKLPERQVGWVMEPASAYVRPVVRLAVRCRTANGQWGYGMLIAPPDLAGLRRAVGQEGVAVTPAELALSYVYAYDARGGGVETSFKGDKQGLGLTKRSKKRFCAQQITTLLGSLAHNVIVWARGWLVGQQPKLAQYGMLRMVRDVFHIQGRIELDAKGHVVGIILNQAAPLVRGIGAALQVLLAPAHIAVNLGET
ncbi:MAG: transposase [Roseiflexaceae bacterium]|nr:transposase [Roseiflexaceae bacterium]